jgi:5-methylcytosine-specific restriction protein A
MPRKPKRPCSYPGCPRLTNDRYCEEHTRIVNNNYNRYERDRETSKRYNRAWKRIRDAYVAAHPLCEECLKQGRVVPVDQVHHIVPLREGGTNDFSNLVSLCSACHARIHAKRGDRWNKRRDYERY